MVGFREMFVGFSGFKGRLLLTSGLVVLCGMLWTGGRQMAAGRSLDRFGIPAASASAWAWGGPPGSGGMWRKADRWGAGAVHLGISFMAALVVASALRAAFKTGVTLLLVGAAALWFLEKQGYTGIWDQSYETVQDEGAAWLTTRLDAAGQWLREHCAHAGIFLAGFGLGLRK